MLPHRLIIQVERAKQNYVTHNTLTSHVFDSKWVISSDRDFSWEDVVIRHSSATVTSVAIIIFLFTNKVA